MKKLNLLKQTAPEKLYSNESEARVLDEALMGLTGAFGREGWTEEESNLLDRLLTAEVPSPAKVVELINLQD